MKTGDRTRDSLRAWVPDRSYRICFSCQGLPLPQADEWNTLWVVARSRGLSPMFELEQPARRRIGTRFGGAQKNSTSAGTEKTNERFEEVIS